ncbi:hypothetical protein Tsp_13806, partial [Trichinella spiralis]|uniref:hypothetical protein n=1 Tax=Trichinella spiralis TaxID=6334 RepID=UPI0001EFDA6F
STQRQCNTAPCVFVSDTEKIDVDGAFVTLQSAVLYLKQQMQIGKFQFSISSGLSRICRQICVCMIIFLIKSNQIDRIAFDLVDRLVGANLESIQFYSLLVVLYAGAASRAFAVILIVHLGRHYQKQYKANALSDPFIVIALVKFINLTIQ